MPANRHNGTTQQVREYVFKHGPSTVYEIAEGLNMPLQQTKTAVALMVARLGGVVPVDKQDSRVIYGIPGRDDQFVKPRGPNAAGPRYQAPMSLLRRDPFEHMRLALTVRGGV